MAGWTLICSVLLTACILQHLCATQTGCRGRCGELFSRGKVCACDDECHTHNECCKDYNEVCISTGSCKDRCQEVFRRGRDCECDPDCTLYNSCCPDYSIHCDMNYTSPEFRSSNQAEACADGRFISALPHDQHTADANVAGGSVVELVPLTEDLAASVPAADADLYLPLPPKNPVESTPGTPHAGTSSPIEALAGGTGHVHISVSINGQANKAPNQVSDVSEPSAGRLSTLTNVAQALEAASTTEQPPQSSSPDLCNGLPINGVASSFNGSIIVFKGHFYWLLDPKTRSTGPAHSITADLGIPSPIDTAFTRCNCEGKTYIIKGDNYWSFQNGVKDSGYPRSVSKDFAGLSGRIVAALSVPATRNKPEAVYFIRNGGNATQKFTYPAGSTPTCTGKKGKSPVTAKNRQPVRLSGEINISLKWKGFPTPVTSALSLPNTKRPDGFDHYVFSWPKIFSIKISGDVPVLASPAKLPAESDVKNWLNCPQ